ncbi:hypothetical protein MMC07_006534 [Pseudocyphellaria aurata]|nr:hypothetical protein [Pseudocyphellaria aurata]
MEPPKVIQADGQKSQKSNRQKGKSRRPKNSRIQKRPMIHPPISSPYAGADHPKVVYISSKTPFVSAVKRVRKLLSLIEKRSVGKVDLIHRKDGDKQKLEASEMEGPSQREKEPEEVLLKGTNRVIEKVLGLALFFQGQEDLNVRLRTGTVGVVDDIVMVAKPSDATEGHQKEEEKESPETQVRKISMLEVAITLK